MKTDEELYLIYAQTVGQALLSPAMAINGMPLRPSHAPQIAGLISDFADELLKEHRKRFPIEPSKDYVHQSKEPKP